MFRLAAALFFALSISTFCSAEMIVQACFSPQGKCSTHILREIDQAKRELLVAVYAFTNDELAGALVQAKKRGVTVQVVIDRDF
ncbi:MAG TPA: phospholipase D-like domain-containing protein, partial [Candidatus Binatia bacterium]|nr:phospholipase D-like domain-containing protein [Candidatus Binatia bacterium]